MVFNQPVTLGRTGFKVGRLGISSSFAAPAEAFEESFERGCNYFNWGTFIKGRSSAMETAVKNICSRGKRQELIIGMLSYAHTPFLTELFLKKGLKKLGVEYTDVLILGYYSKRPPQRVIDHALKLKQQGLVRAVGLTGHNRMLFPRLFKENLFDLYHIRYNAVNCGAEADVFPFIPKEEPPGIVTFTATCWRKLLDAKKMPPGQEPLSAADCYRFVLSNPAVDVCMMGAASLDQMRQNLKVLETGPLDAGEMDRIRQIGDHIYGKKRIAKKS